MQLKTVDASKRIILTEANPGEVYRVEYLGGGTYRLTRVNARDLENPPARKPARV